jgi:hypothetical protein
MLIRYELNHRLYYDLSVVLLLGLLDQAWCVSALASCDMNKSKRVSLLSIPFRSDNVIINQLFGVTTGLGMGILTFDWSQILVVGNPLNIPWWAQVNVGVSFVVLYWFIAPLLYYTNVRLVAYQRLFIKLTNMITTLRSGIPLICPSRLLDCLIGLDRTTISQRLSTRIIR